MPRYSIRDILLVTTIFALAIGWWLDRGRFHAASSKADLYQRMVQRVVDLHAEATGDSFEMNDGRYSFSSWRPMREMSSRSDAHPHLNTTRFRGKAYREFIDSALAP